MGFLIVVCSTLLQQLTAFRIQDKFLPFSWRGSRKTRRPRVVRAYGASLE